MSFAGTLHQSLKLHKMKMQLRLENTFDESFLFLIVTFTQESTADENEDGSTPYQEDYLPPGLQEEASTLNESEINENLLDDEEEEGAEEERSWKRRNNEED